MLRPTFLGFETAKRGLTAAQKGLDIAGQNLTNWDSAGYTRQRITQVALAPDSYRSRYATSKVGLAGQGVEITGIDQTRDVFLDKRFREENGDLGTTDRPIPFWRTSRLPSMSSTPIPMWVCVPAC